MIPKINKEVQRVKNRQNITYNFERKFLNKFKTYEDTVFNRV